MRSLFICFENWVQKLLSCKVEKLDSAKLFDDNRVDFFILSIELWHQITDFLLSHTSSHNSIRYRQIFDIIEFMCRSIIELQIKFSLASFENWVSKLLSCKIESLNRLLNSFRGSRIARSILSVNSDSSKKCFFEKNINERPCN